MNVRHLEPAADDVLAAVERAEKRFGKGDLFDADYRKAVAAIGTNPRMYPRTEDGPDEPENREYFMDRFEYRVVYVVRPDEVVVVAVIHARRRAGLWLPRLAELDSPEDLP
jgi:plasmid stabilization system protein ParE